MTSQASSLIWDRYNEVLVEVDGWKLMKRAVPDRSHKTYQSMMWHKCKSYDGYNYNGHNWMNGCDKQVCYRCKGVVPNEVWALWLLHNGGI